MKGKNKETQLFSKSVKGKIGCTLQNQMFRFTCQIICQRYVKTKACSEITEPEVMRHFVNLSSNHHIDKDILYFLHNEV